LIFGDVGGRVEEHGFGSREELPTGSNQEHETGYEDDAEIGPIVGEARPLLNIFHVRIFCFFHFQLLDILNSAGPIRRKYPSCSK
jgi:hypothetical protein